MSSFPLPLVIRALGPEEVRNAESTRALFQLREEFRYLSDTFGEIVVPAGFVTDFASIPRAALWYVDDDDPCILFPSVIHDYLYTRRGDLGLGSRVTFSREQADQVLREAMLVCGARKAQAFVVYLAVRARGGSRWN